MGMADFILAGEGDLYDINEYHMLAHLIINKVDDFGTFLAQSVHEDIVLYMESSRVGKKYRYAGIPWYFFGVVRNAAHLPVPRYSGVSIYSNRKP